MVTLVCPLCGSRVDTRRAEINTRYTCRKCHSPFHLNKAGIAVVGEPPSIEVELAEAKQKFREGLEKIPFKKIAIGAGAFVVVLILGYALFGPSERLESAGQRAARALADNDESYFKSIAAPGTSEDVGRWFKAAHAQLEAARGRWHGGNEEVVEAHVGSEDKANRKGSVLISIHRTIGSGFDVSLADPAAATAMADAPYEVATEWTRGRFGRWQIDGHATYAKLPQSP